MSTGINTTEINSAADKCWVKITIKSDDVEGNIKKEGDRLVLRLNYTSDITGECDCGEKDACKEVRDADDGTVDPPPSSSMIWGGSESQHKPYCVDRPHSPHDPNKGYSGVLKGGFTFVTCVETEDLCETQEDDEGNTYYWVCEGEFKRKIKKEFMYVLPSDTTVGSFCGGGVSPAYMSGKLQEDLEERVKYELENSNLLRCNKDKEEEVPKQYTPFLGGYTLG